MLAVLLNESAMESALVTSNASSSKKRVRKANYTDAEVKVMLQLVAAEAEIVMSPLTDGPTNELKAQAWERIATRVSAFSGVERTSDDVRDKWSRLKTLVAKQIEEQVKTGVPPKPIPYQDLIISIAVRDTKKLKMDMVEGLDTDSEIDQFINQDSEKMNSGEQLNVSSSSYPHHLGGNVFQPIQSRSSDGTEDLSSPKPASLPQGVASVSPVGDDCVRSGSSDARRGSDGVRMAGECSSWKNMMPTKASPCQKARQVKTLLEMAHSMKASGEWMQLKHGMPASDDAHERAIFVRYLQSEIAKNRAKKTLMRTKQVLVENMNRKVLLEIEKLERELGDTNDNDLNSTADGTARESEGP